MIIAFGYEFLTNIVQGIELTEIDPDDKEHFSSLTNNKKEIYFSSDKRTLKEFFKCGKHELKKCSTPEKGSGELHRQPGRR